MFCFKCGNQLPDGAKFCDKCGATNENQPGAGQPAGGQPPQAQQFGAPVQQNPAFQPGQPGQQWQGGVPGGPPGGPQGFGLILPQKKPLNKLLIIIPAAVIVVALAVVLVINVFAGNSYEKAEMKTFSGLFSGISSGGRLDFTVDYEPSSQMTRETDIPDMMLDGSLYYGNQEALARAAFSADRDLITEVFLAFDSNGLSFALPDITDYYLRFLSDGEDSGLDMSKLDTSRLNDTFKEIGKLYFALARGISEVEKGVRLNVGNSTVSCDMYTMDFREEATAEFLLAAIREIRKNANLMDFMSDLVVSFGGRSSEFENMLYDLEDNLEDIRSNSRLFRMIVWVSGGKIVARQIDRVMGADVSLSYQNLQKGNFAHFEVKATIDDVKINLTGDFEKNRGSWSGTPRLTVTDTYYNEDMFTLRANCENISFTKNTVSGVIKFTGGVESYYDSYDYDIKVTLTGDGSRQSARIEGEVGYYSGYYGDSETVDMGRLNVSYVYNKGGNIDMPRLDEDMAVLIGNYSSSNQRRAEAMYREIDRYREQNNQGRSSYNPLVDQVLYTIMYSLPY